MEFAAVEKFAEDERDLFLDDPWSVVLNRHAKPAGLWLIDLNPDFRYNSRFLTCIQGVVNGFFDGCQKGFAWVVETKKMFILGEEFAYRNIALFGRHTFGSGATCFRLSARGFRSHG